MSPEERQKRKLQLQKMFEESREQNKEFVSEYTEEELINMINGEISSYRKEKLE